MIHRHLFCTFFQRSHTQKVRHSHDLILVPTISIIFGITLLIFSFPKDIRGAETKVTTIDDGKYQQLKRQSLPVTPSDPDDLTPASTSLMGMLLPQGWPFDNEALVSDWSPWSTRKRPHLTSSSGIYNAWHKKTYHHHAYNHGAELGRILKAQYGGYFVASIIQVVAAILFVQGFLGAKYSSDGTEIVPPHIDHLPTSGWSGGQPTYPQKSYQSAGPQSDGYSSPSLPSSYRNLYRNSEGYYGADQGRSVIRYARESNQWRSDDEPSVSSHQKNVDGYWRRVEVCAEHAMCLRGQELRPKIPQNFYENGQWTIGHHDGGGGSRIRRQDDNIGHTNFEHILETMNDLKKKGLIQNEPLFPKLYKAFKVGQQNSAKCSKRYKQCSSGTASRISKTLRGMDDYLHL